MPDLPIRVRQDEPRWTRANVLEHVCRGDVFHIGTSDAFSDLELLANVCKKNDFV